MINPDEFNQLFTNIVKPKKPVDFELQSYTIIKKQVNLYSIQ